MDKISPIKERILQFIENQYIKKIDFCEATGISYANLKGKSLFSEIGGDKIAEILSIYPDINPEWLVTGNGSMLRDKSDAPVSSASANAVKAQKGTSPAIPLVGLSAIAGFGSGNFSISEQDVKDYYVIPKFKYNRVDFMIEVSGSSMYPKYNSGDIVACTIIKEKSFIQWNKCHVIATKEQGLLVKRIREGHDANYILAVSDNKEYPPFEIPKNEITGIAIVVGVIRLE